MTGNDTVKLISSYKSFGGFQKIFSHRSKELKCDVNFAVYLPPQAEDRKVPVLYFLSGLTCTETNFIEKSGFQRYAAEHGLMVVCPNTSPRGCNIEGEEVSWSFGTGAGFYLDATESKWKENYRMFSYVTKEIPALINENFPSIPDKQSIFGHSMGGHGAIICALKCPGQYKSVSAFAPICNPTISPWGITAFTGYLGPDAKAWEDYDATYLVKQYKGPPYDIRIDQGKDDKFLETELFPHNFVTACSENRMPVVLNLHEGYDHSFYFIATFVGEHITHHAKYLQL